HTDPCGLWKRVACEGGATECWEAENGDTWRSFAKATGFYQRDLLRFFPGETISSGQVFDVSGLPAFLLVPQEVDLTSHLKHDIDMIPLPIGGGGLVREESAGLLSRAFSSVGRWLGLGVEAETAANSTQSAIKITARALKHVLERHAPAGAR